MEHKRRVLLTEPGEPLIVSMSPMETAIRFGQFCELTGIPASALATSPLCSIPLPVYPETFDGPRRWSTVRPEAMWHPLLWMPARLADRYQMSDDPKDLEDDDLWSVRVALELSASGLYDDESGTWVDVLSLVGVDLEDPADMERVRRWMAGEPDADLDSINLSSFIDLPGEDVDWAASTALDCLDKLRISSWAFAADEMLETCTDFRSAQGAGEDLDELRWIMELTVSMGRTVFASVPEGSVDAGSDEAIWWSALESRVLSFTGSSAELLTGPVLDMQARLALLRGVFWPLMLSQATSHDPSSVAAPGVGVPVPPQVTPAFPSPLATPEAAAPPVVPPGIDPWTDPTQSW